MNMKREVVVLSGVRTAIGDYGGTLKDIPPSDLAAQCVREAVRRAGVEPQGIGHAVFGNIIHTEARDMYLARVAAVNGGLPVETPALTLNRLCGSGLQAIVTASQMILLGDCDAAVAGGAEGMSRGPYWLPAQRWGQRLGNGEVIDVMNAALHDPFHNIHMGVTAENIAKKWGITRQEQDEFAVESHRRAAAAIAAGNFKEQILPIEIKTRKGVTLFDTDEHVRADATVESMGKLKPVFDPAGSVTAGNASGINDAAAAVVLMEGEAARAKGLEPLARLVGYAHAGVEPAYMGIGPVPAVKKVLERTGLALGDIDVFELNEAFAAQSIAVVRDLGLPTAKVNPNGSGISLGHPVGATGAIITIKAIAELHRTGKRYALATLCIGGGQGIAAIFERL
ncbi:MAG: acetyl-CoA C-acyltransferase family protein [Gammaproteobacteria bacterium]|nr:acetyl-CoA C-acyltransferase family protein [Gammaproteobacteria bacterium]MBI5616164.1 acetyl-CoA C-acyltransferase family protein [Gammaproteobacteria bacterium]